MVESSFIKQIPVNERLNKSIPRVSDPSQVSEECKHDLQSALKINNNDDLTTVAEVNDSPEDKDLRAKLL